MHFLAMSVLPSQNILQYLQSAEFEKINLTISNAHLLTLFRLGKHLFHILTDLGILLKTAYFHLPGLLDSMDNCRYCTVIREQSLSLIWVVPNRTALTKLSSQKCSFKWRNLSIFCDLSTQKKYRRPKSINIQLTLFNDCTWTVFEYVLSTSHNLKLTESK